MHVSSAGQACRWSGGSGRPRFGRDAQVRTTTIMASAAIPIASALIAFVAERSGLPASNRGGPHLRELEHRTGVNSMHLVRELRPLGAGILLSNQVGNQVIYRVSRGRPICGELRSVVRRTVGPTGMPGEVLEPFVDRVELAYIHGHRARGEERSDSGADSMIVSEVSLRRLSPVRREAERTIRRTVNPTLFRPGEYASGLEDGNSHVRRFHDGLRNDVT